MSDEERTAIYEEAWQEGGFRFLFGHEMGHIKSEHVLYTSVADWLKTEAGGRERRQYAGLLPNMMEWQRESEVTADRAGLLACGDVNVACRTLLTLSLGGAAICGGGGQGDALILRRS